MQCQIEISEQIDHTVYEYDFGIVHLTTFACELKEGEPWLTEHKEIRWAKPKELNTLDWAPADIPTVEKLEKMNLSNE